MDHVCKVYLGASCIGLVRYDDLKWIHTSTGCSIHEVFLLSSAVFNVTFGTKCKKSKWHFLQATLLRLAKPSTMYGVVTKRLGG